MKLTVRVPAFVAALLGCGCASSNWSKIESVPGGKLYIPKLYAPLLPGSIYPDKKVTIPPKGRPAMVLVCPAKGECREKAILAQASQRGLVVLVGREGKDDLLRTRTEADPERIGWLLVRPTGDLLRRWAAAGAQWTVTAVIGPPAFPSYPSKHLLLAALLSAQPLEAPDGTVLKLYSPNQKNLFPDEAFRDAVEWLAAELAAP